MMLQTLWGITAPSLQTYSNGTLVSVIYINHSNLTSSKLDAKVLRSHVMTLRTYRVCNNSASYLKDPGCLISDLYCIFKILDDCSDHSFDLSEDFFYSHDSYKGYLSCLTH